MSWEDIGCSISKFVIFNLGKNGKKSCFFHLTLYVYMYVFYSKRKHVILVKQKSKTAREIFYYRSSLQLFYFHVPSIIYDFSPQPSTVNSINL